MLYRLSYTRVALTLSLAARFATVLANCAHLQQKIPLRRGVGDDAVPPDDGSLRELRRFLLALTHDVGHRIACGEKIVGDDPAMAAPPEGLCAHDGASFCLADAAQFIEAGLEGRRGGVIGVVAEILVLPEAIGRRALILAPAPQPSEVGDPL